MQMFMGACSVAHKTFTIGFAHVTSREASPGKLDAFEEELFRNADMADAPPAAAVLLGTSDGPPSPSADDPPLPSSKGSTACLTGQGLHGGKTAS